MPNLNDPAHTDGVFTPVVNIVVDDREKSAVPALLQSDPEVAVRRNLSTCLRQRVAEITDGPPLSVKPAAAC